MTSKEHLDDSTSSSSDVSSFCPPNYSKFGWIHNVVMRDLLSDDEEVVFDALRELAALCDSDQQSLKDRAAVHEACGHFAIIGVLNKWYTSREIAVEGLRALANVGSNTAFRDAAVKHGGFEAVLLAMKNNPNDKYVQRNGCAALCRFCLANRRHAEYLVLELEGLPLLVEAMAAFPNEIRLQDWAVSTIYGFSDVEQLQYPIIEAGT